MLYHFTGREYLPAVAHEGLSKGEVPVTRRTSRIA